MVKVLMTSELNKSRVLSELNMIMVNMTKKFSDAGLDIKDYGISIPSCTDILDYDPNSKYRETKPSISYSYYRSKGTLIGRRDGPIMFFSTQNVWKEYKRKISTIDSLIRVQKERVLAAQNLKDNEEGFEKVFNEEGQKLKRFLFSRGKVRLVGIENPRWSTRKTRGQGDEFSEGYDIEVSYSSSDSFSQRIYFIGNRDAITGIYFDDIDFEPRDNVITKSLQGNRNYISKYCFSQLTESKEGDVVTVDKIFEARRKRDEILNKIWGEGYVLLKELELYCAENNLTFNFS